MAKPEPDRAAASESEASLDLAGDFFGFSPRKFAATIALYFIWPDDFVDALAERDWETLIRPFRFLCICSAILIMILWWAGQGTFSQLNERWSITSPDTWNVLLTVVAPFIVVQYVLLFLLSSPDPLRPAPGPLQLLNIYTYWLGMVQLWWAPVELWLGFGMSISEDQLTKGIEVAYGFAGLYFVFGSFIPVVEEMFDLGCLGHALSWIAGAAAAAATYFAVNGF